MGPILIQALSGAHKSSALEVCVGHAAWIKLSFHAFFSIAWHFWAANSKLFILNRFCKSITNIYHDNQLGLY